jgi:hypothetical protein
MLKNIIVTIIAGLFVLTIGILGYLFYNYAKDIQLTRNQNQNSQSAKGQLNGISTVPAGTELSLDKPTEGSLPTTTDPQGGSIPLGTIGAGDSPNGSAAEANKPSGLTISMDTNNWKTYTNKKYNYSFKYPREYDYSACDKTSPCHFGQVYEKDGGDSAWLNGAVSNQGWPFIIINHYDNDSYTLPKNVKFFDWLKQKMGWTKDNAPKDFNYSINTSRDPKKAMKVTVPATPQAYARDEIYFEKENKIFEIQLMSSDKPEAQEFYNTWLKNFIFN